MSKLSAIIGSTFALALTLAVQTPQAQARSVPALAGKPNSNNSPACFTEYYGSMINTCTSSQYLVVPLAIDAAMTYAPTINAYVPSGGSITCWSAAQGWTGTIVTTPGVTRGAGYPTLAPGSLTVPSHGQLVSYCTMSTNARMINVEY